MWYCNRQNLDSSSQYRKGKLREREKENGSRRNYRNQAGHDADLCRQTATWLVALFCRRALALWFSAAPKKKTATTPRNSAWWNSSSRSA